MNKQKIAELRAGLETGFINSGYNSSLAYQPQFLSNNHKEGKKVYTSTQVGKQCQFTTGLAVVISTAYNETRIQPNAQCPEKK